MSRNIKIAYLLALLKNSWFFIGIWVLYYLRFTDYAGIGWIETALYVSLTVGEIPTGAVADLLGKKKTLILAFLLTAACNFLMAAAPNFSTLIIAVILGGIGLSFASGSYEALIYDSLKQEGKENRYGKVIANVGTITWLAPALTGVISGFLYNYSPSLPFALTGCAYLLGFIACLFLREPTIDTQKFTFSSFFKQNAHGLQQLFRTEAIKRLTIISLSLGVLIVVADEMINSFLGVEFGFNPVQLGILWAVVYLLAAGASQLTPLVTKRFPHNAGMLFIGCLLVITFLVSPVVGMILGGISLLIRAGLQAIYMNLISININEHTPSQDRATTMSTFNMLKNIPYMLGASTVGALADTYSARNIAAGMGVILGVLLLIQTLDALRRRHV